jgi:hypothetical protein
MNRSVVALLVLSVASGIGTGCNAPDCGKGTVQKQDPDGTVHCVVADVALDPAACDPIDAFIVGGKCVSKRICDPATTTEVVMMDGKIVCRGTGMGGCRADTPTGDNITITGEIYDWETGQKVGMGKSYKTQAHDPLVFLSGTRTGIGMPDTNMNGCYAINNFPRPGSGLVAIAVDDPDGAPDELALSGAGAQVMVGGKIYKVDVYIIKKSRVEAWKTQTGVDYPTIGAYIPCFYGDLPGLPEDATQAHATMPIAGVRLFAQGSPMAFPNTKYFDNPQTVNAAATMTTANGCGIVQAPPISVFTGMGGMCRGAPCMWGNVTGASTTGVMFFARFHTL